MFSMPAANKHLFFAYALIVMGLTAGCASTNPASQEAQKKHISNEQPTEFRSKNPPRFTSASDRLHEKNRSQPYPRNEHVLYLNPPPLIVPQQHITTDQIQFSLSNSPDFTSQTTLISSPTPWLMFSPHRVLAPGQWYWRYRSANKNKKPGAWSKTIIFTVTEQTPHFATPPFECMLNGIPQEYPRLFCFLDKDLKNIKNDLTSEPDYKQLMIRAQSALNSDYESISDNYRTLSTIKLNIQHLHHAYTITGKTIYMNKMLEMARYILAQTDLSKSLNNDFAAGFYKFSLMHTYDACYEQLSPLERNKIETAILQIGEIYYRKDLGLQENHVFDNHFWQHSIVDMFQIGLMFHNKYSIARELLEYYYELWCTRAPASAFNRDGNWINGNAYFNTNIYTLFYMGSMLSYLTGTDFLQHPWYQKAGQALPYTWPPASMSFGFGDGHEKNDSPPRTRIAFADFLARETYNPYAAWYVDQSQKVATGNRRLESDYLLRLYRLAHLNQPYGINSKLPELHPQALWFKDSGEVVMHSDIANPSCNLMLGFRSSPFGSGSHTLADQNGFNLHYKGKPVYRSVGHYLDFSDPHNLLSYRHTKAHNTILLDGIGQPFSTQGYGNIARFISGKHLSYCLGDASNAYSGISDDPMWIKHFERNGLSQTPEFGFGKTQLKTYRRHVVMLRPNKILLYDELEAEKPTQWNWLLHSPHPFQIDGENQTLSTHNPEDGFQSKVQFYCAQPATITQTNQYPAPPNPKLNKRHADLKNQWHLTATFNSAPKNRILTFIEVVPEGEPPAPIHSDEGGILQFGDWTIKAELNPEMPAHLYIENTKTCTEFDYGTEKFVLSKSYERQFSGSSILLDDIDGKRKVIETSDQEPLPSR